MPKYVSHSQVRLFTDDTIVYLSVSAVDDCNKLQEDLKRLEDWEREWLMEFHPTYHQKEIQSHIPIHLTWPCP